jgi:nucleoside-diphosphate-sugar epimerase
MPAAFFSDAVALFTGKPGLLCRGKIKEMAQPAWLCSNRKIRSHLPWSPVVSLEEGIRRTAAWYIREGWL